PNDAADEEEEDDRGGREEEDKERYSEGGQGRSVIPVTSVSTQPILVKGMHANRLSRLSTISSNIRSHSQSSSSSTSTAPFNFLSSSSFTEESNAPMYDNASGTNSAAEVAAAAAAADAAAQTPMTPYASQYSVGGLLPYARSFASRFLQASETDDTPFRGDGGPGETAVGGGARQLEGVLDPDLESWISDEDREDDDHGDVEGDEEMEHEERDGAGDRRGRKVTYSVSGLGSSAKENDRTFGTIERKGERGEGGEGGEGGSMDEGLNERNVTIKGSENCRVQLGRSASTGQHRRRASTSVVGSRDLMPGGGVGRLSPSGSPSSLSLLSQSESGGFGATNLPVNNGGSGTIGYTTPNTSSVSTSFSPSPSGAAFGYTPFSATFFPLAAPDHLEAWTHHLVRMASRAGEALRPDVREGDDMDIRHYVKIKRIPLPTHSLSQDYQGIEDGGLRPTKHMKKQQRRYAAYPSYRAHLHSIERNNGQSRRVKGKRSKASAPQGLDACLEPEYVTGVYSRVEGEFVSLKSLFDQEAESLRVLVARIVALKPTLLLVGKGVSRIALDILHEQGIAVARNVRRTVLEAVARCTKASIVESIERFAASDTVLGSCERFSVRVYPTCKFIDGMWQLCRQSYLWFEGGIPTAGCTIILKSLGDRDSLARLKKTLDLLVFAAYHLRLETFLMDDQEMSIQEDSSSSSSSSSSPPTTPHLPPGHGPAPLVKAERPYRDTVLSLSPSVHFPLPYLLLLVRRDVERVNPKEVAERRMVNLVCSIRTTHPLLTDWMNYNRHVRAAESWLSSLPFPIPSPLDHQNIIVLSWRVCTVSGTPCASPTLLSIEYYRRAGGDITLGYFLEGLFMGAETMCPERRCGRPQRLHTLTYAHGKVRVDVRVDPGLPGGVSGIADRLLVWGECSACNRIGPVRPLSEASFAYSWGKYLELTFYGLSPSRSLCICGAGSFASVRAFGLRGLIVRIRRGPLQLKEVSSPAPILLPKEDIKAIEDKEQCMEDRDGRGETEKEQEVEAASKDDQSKERSPGSSGGSKDDPMTKKESKDGLEVDDERELLFHRAERLFTSIEQRLDQLGVLENSVQTPEGNSLDSHVEGKEEGLEEEYGGERGKKRSGNGKGEEDEGRKDEEKKEEEKRDEGRKSNDNGKEEKEEKKGVEAEVNDGEEIKRNREEEKGESKGNIEGKNIDGTLDVREVRRLSGGSAKIDMKEEEGIPEGDEKAVEDQGENKDEENEAEERGEHLDVRREESLDEENSAEGKEPALKESDSPSKEEVEGPEKKRTLDGKGSNTKERAESGESTSPMSWKTQLDQDRTWFHHALAILPLKPTPLECVPLWLGLQDRAIRWESRTEGAIQEWMSLRTPPPRLDLYLGIFREKTSLVMGGDREGKEKGKDIKGEDKEAKEKEGESKAKEESDKVKEEEGPGKKKDNMEEGKEVKGEDEVTNEREARGETDNDGSETDGGERSKGISKSVESISGDDIDEIPTSRQLDPKGQADDKISGLTRTSPQGSSQRDTRGLGGGRNPQRPPTLSHSLSYPTGEGEESRGQQHLGSRRERSGKGSNDKEIHFEESEGRHRMGKGPSYMKPTYSSQRLRANGTLGILPPSSAPQARLGNGERKGRRQVESNPSLPVWRNIHRSRSRSIAQVYRSSRDAAKVESDEEEFEGSLGRPRRRNDATGRIPKERGRGREDEEPPRLMRTPPASRRGERKSRRDRSPDTEDEEDDILSYGIEEMMKQYGEGSIESEGSLGDDDDDDDGVEEGEDGSRRSNDSDMEGTSDIRFRRTTPRSRRPLVAVQEDVSDDDDERKLGKVGVGKRKGEDEGREAEMDESKKIGKDDGKEDVGSLEEGDSKGKSPLREKTRRHLARRMGGLTLGPGLAGAMDFGGPRRAVSAGTPTAEGAHPDRLSLVKTITNLWATGDPSVETIHPLQYPLETSEHLFHKAPVMVRENEPSSIIAFSLSSKEYREELRQMQDNPRSDRGQGQGLADDMDHVNGDGTDLHWKDEGDGRMGEEASKEGEALKQGEEGLKGDEEGVSKSILHPPASPTLITPLNPKGAPLPHRISTTPSSASSTVSTVSSSSSFSSSGASSSAVNPVIAGMAGGSPVVNVPGGSTTPKETRGQGKAGVDERSGGTEEERSKKKKEPEEDRKSKGRAGPPGSIKDLGKKFSRSSLPTLTPNIISSACPSPDLAPRPTMISRAPSPLGSPRMEEGSGGPSRRGAGGMEEKERDYFSSPGHGPFTFPVGPGERMKKTVPEIKEALLNPSENHIKYQFDAEGSIKLYCKVFFAGQFEALRRNCGYDGTTYIESLSRCVRWSASGGKSGSAFLKTRDDRLLIKQMSRAELDAFLTFAPAYFAYMSRSFFHELPTMLAKVFGFYRIGFKNPVTGKSIRLDVLIMENLFYNRNFTKIFDLKGSMRNRHVSTEEKHAVLLDENLVELIYESPLLIREHSKILLRQSVWNDTLFLSKFNIMDYSLLVGVDEEKGDLVVGIVDFIRTFTWDKKTGELGQGNGIPRRGWEGANDHYTQAVQEAIQRGDGELLSHGPRQVLPGWDDALSRMKECTFDVLQELFWA
ncbi:hypothetical protein BJ684DRAFT_15339, partial [Piptocephalis cylindrospora]